MKYEGQRETYEFIGDSRENKAKRKVSGEPTTLYSQTDIINAFSENRGSVCGGTKLYTKKDDSRLVYMVYFGKERFNPDQIIKIIIDKENLEKGDVNTLAIDSLCQYSIRVNQRYIKKIITGVIAGSLTGVAMIGMLIAGLKYANEKEGKVQAEANKQYQEWLKQQQMQKGTYKESLENYPGYYDEEKDEFVMNSSSGRSY